MKNQVLQHNWLKNYKKVKTNQQNLETKLVQYFQISYNYPDF